MPSFAANHFVGKLILVSGLRRISEKFDFATDVEATAKQLFRNVLDYRAYLYGNSVQVDYAALSLTESPRDSRIPGNQIEVITDVTTQYHYVAKPLSTESSGSPPVVAITDIDSPGTGPLFTFFTDEGKWDSVHIRMIRDGWVSGNSLTVATDGTFAALALDAAMPSLPTAANALKNYLTALKLWTVLASPVFGGGHNLYTYTDYRYERITTKKVGTGYPRTVARRKAKI